MLKLFRWTAHVLSMIAPLVFVTLTLSAQQSNADSHRDNGGRIYNPTYVALALNQASPEPTQGDSTGDPKKTDNAFWDRLSDPVTWFTGLLVIVGWYQWRAIKKQAEHMEVGLRHASDATSAANRNATAAFEAASAAKQSAEVAQATLELTHRAYVSISEAQLSPTTFGKPDRFPNLVIQLTNSGQRPASLIAWATCIMVHTPLPNPADNDLEWREHPVLIDPGRTITLQTDHGHDGATFSSQDWKDLVSGRLPFAIYGAIRYDAGLDQIGETGFAFVYDSNATMLEQHRRFISTGLAGYTYYRYTQKKKG